MKVATIIARLLLGLVFTVFGANILHPFLHLPQPQLPDLAVKFFTALAGSHYIQVVGVVQLVGGLILLSGYFVPLGLTLLGPVIVNILLFHILLAQEGLAPLPLLVAVLWVAAFAGYWKSFEGVLKPKPRTA
jgi:hypothetical protein